MYPQNENDKASEINQEIDQEIDQKVAEEGAKAADSGLSGKDNPYSPLYARSRKSWAVGYYRRYWEINPGAMPGDIIPTDTQ